ncbi:MAG TPA: phosphoribosylanthranilate isomerase [Methylomirabilota bacterium]|nr:phosphoribosylanthranilate isomerase [Methylomirabilota bacterium]
MASPRIKICCIMSIEEARLAIAAGASALGLVGRMPSGPGVIEDALIAEIAAAVPPPVATFLLTSETTADGIVDHVRRVGTNTVQIVDAIEPFVYGRIRAALPRLKIVQVLHVSDAAVIDEARRLAPLVDAFLLDSGNPTLAVKELGGTGRVHDWDVSRRLVDDVGRPVFLAGGLRVDNVARAIETVRPFGLDLCSSVRSDGRLDPAKLGAFFAAAQQSA